MLEVTTAMRYDMLKDEKGKEQKNGQASILESEPLSQTWNVTSRCSWESGACSWMSPDSEPLEDFYKDCSSENSSLDKIILLYENWASDYLCSINMFLSKLYEEMLL